MPNSAVISVWGYSLTPCAPGVITKPGGPVITVNVGDVVTVVLHNDLNVVPAETTSLLFQGQPVPPDTTGAAAGGTASYTFTATNPGTFLYEAGFATGNNTQHQVAMGLYGALIVRPATVGQAYNSATTAFNNEGVLVLGEIDTTLNSASNKLNFDMRNFKPRYRTINGKAYSATDPITSAAGNTVLLRYVNAGMTYHSLSVLGGTQQIIAYDGNPLTYSHKVAAETFGPGQTADALVVVPAASPVGGKLAVYDGTLLLNNSTAAGFGGMMTFIDVAAAGGGDTAGPATTGVTALPSPTNGTVPVAVAASVSDVATGNANVTAAEYRIDGGTATAMAATDATFDSATEAVSATISAATMGTLSAGSHTVSVRGQDSIGNVGAWNSTTLNVVLADSTGPVTTGPSLTPNPTNGTVNVAVHATTSDATTGGSNIGAGEFFIDAVGANGTGTAMTPNVAQPTASIDGSIPAATVLALPSGPHTIFIHGRDSVGAGNWGATTSIVLNVDKAGPVMVGNTAYSNGVNGVNSSTPAVRVTGLVTDATAGGSNVVAAEGFFGLSAGAPGTGFLFVPADGAWNSPAENVSVDIPLLTINSLFPAEGTYPMQLRGKDAAGNWGTPVAVSLIIDKTLPVMGAPTAVVAPASPAVTTSVTLNVAGTDNVGAGRVEWFRGADPGLGNGTAMTITGTTSWSATSGPINVSALPSGRYTFSVRARDNAMNWTAVQTVQVTVIRGSLFFSTSGNTNPPAPVVGTADDSDIYNWLGAFSRTVDVTAITNAIPVGANVDGLDYTSTTSFCVSFTGNVTLPGIAGTVADEDVVCRNGTTWSMFFDGSVRRPGHGHVRPRRDRHRGQLHHGHPVLLDRCQQLAAGSGRWRRRRRHLPLERWVVVHPDGQRQRHNCGRHQPEPARRRKRRWSCLRRCDALLPLLLRRHERADARYGGGRGRRLLQRRHLVGVVRRHVARIDPERQP